MGRPIRSIKRRSTKRRSIKRKKRTKGGNKSKCEIFVIDQNNFDEYQKMLENLQMCDTDYISPDLEEITYDVLEYEGNMGFFCRDPVSKKISSVLCIDMNTNENMPSLVMNNIAKSNATAEIMLLCSSKTNRVPGATRDLFNNVMQYLSSIKKQHVYLRVARPTTNKRAIDFYQSLGFKALDKTSEKKETGLMMLTLPL